MPVPVSELPYIPPSPRETLDVHARLSAVVGDHRAYFLPTTHRELGQSLTILDQVNSPRFSNGIPSYLHEIEIHSINTAMTKSGKAKFEAINVGNRAVQSVLFEFSDHYNGMTRTVTALSILGRTLARTDNGALVLQDVADDNNGYTTGMTELIRTLEIAAVKNGTKIKPYPLTTRQVPPDRKQRDLGKNKIVRSSYEGELDADRSARLAYIMGTYTVREARNSLPQSILNAENGMKFWRKVLQTTHFGAYQNMANQALRATLIR